MFNELKGKIDKDVLKEEYTKGFWFGFTTGTIVITVLYAILIE